MSHGIKAETRYYRQLTRSTRDPFKQNALVMGRRTWVAEGCRAVPNALSVVLTTTNTAAVVAAGCVACGSLAEALGQCWDRADVESVYVVGGAGVYAEAMAMSACSVLFLTRVHGTHTADVFYPAIPAAYRRAHHVVPPAISAEAATFNVDVWVREGVTPEADLSWCAKHF
eukprot:TRINITY_DN5086_c0_g1_i2.p1 TRINITY_DN5086_c0_g1~~TRINITY_DN5086_c0_g1_i2.p1  ORF type:complete len:171 (-),score=34.70 TRINITY_DN5086_c0_g1_i2:26-538(-)